MKTIKGISALMLASAFMLSTAAFAVPSKAVVKKQQAKTEKTTVAKKETKTTVKTEKKAPKKMAAKKHAKKASKKVAPASK